MVGCANDTRKAALVPPADEKLIADPILEKAVREKLEKPEGKLTKADLEKVTILYLRDNPDLTKAQIDELQKALPKCNIYSNPTK